MDKRKRYWFVLFSVVAIAAIVVLAGGLSTLDLGYEARPLPRLPTVGRSPDSLSPATDIFTLAFRVILIVAGALLPFSIIYFLVSPEARRQVFRNLIIVLSFLLPLYLIYRAQSGASQIVDEAPLPPPASGELPQGPEVPFPPGPSQWLVFVANVGVALLLAALLVGLAWILWRRRQRASATPLDRLAQEAQEAIDAIQAGDDLRDTVTRCYYEMMQVLREERGIRRQRAMTPREFERRLEEVGIPTTQVRRLTRLFEEVRYGDKRLDDEDERQAVISLTSIVRFCRSTS